MGCYVNLSNKLPKHPHISMEVSVGHNKQAMIVVCTSEIRIYRKKSI
jgi:hypothetical protein